ncbi:MAG TPA: NAD(P)H-hydrate epimerase [Anaerolineales bacterium]|nr:NAD(P)H-hydrate epimerase [Anaerolineales bacterium]
MNSNAQNLLVLTTDQMTEVDRLMIEEWGITLIQMMESAGRDLAELARRQLGGTVHGKKVAVLCGIGNNGGGGMTAARHLHNWGASVDVILIGNEERLKDVPAQQWRILQKLGITRSTIELSDAGMILDAMLGYGAKGDPRPPIANWIQLANESGLPILSLDSPSGLDTTTGIPGSSCIHASATLTLALPKRGLLAPKAEPLVGDLYLADIGVPPELYAAPSLGLKVISPFSAETLVRLT